MRRSGPAQQWPYERMHASLNPPLRLSLSLLWSAHTSQAVAAPCDLAAYRVPPASDPASTTISQCLLACTIPQHAHLCGILEHTASPFSNAPEPPYPKPYTLHPKP
eukprot:81641-Chlamydomonas_euryale.AAC.4